MTTLRESDKLNNLRSMFRDRSNKICKDKCPGAIPDTTTIRASNGNDFEKLTHYFMTRLDILNYSNTISTQTLIKNSIFG